MAVRETGWGGCAPQGALFQRWTTGGVCAQSTCESRDDFSLFLKTGKHIPLINPEGTAFYKQLLTCLTYKTLNTGASLVAEGSRILLPLQETRV